LKDEGVSLEKVSLKTKSREIPTCGDTPSAINELKRFWKSGLFPRLYSILLGRGDVKLKPVILKLVSFLPVFNRDFLSNPKSLVSLGVWQECPKNFDLLQKQEKYFPGRQILIKTTVDPFGKQNEDEYLLYDENFSEELHLTHKAYIVKKLYQNGNEQKHIGYLVKIRSKDGWVEKESSVVDVESLNNEHCYAGGNSLQFEDAVSCKYESALCRLQCLEIALSLEKLVRKLDFQDEDNASKIQKLCIQELRKVLNITPLQTGLQQGRSKTTRQVEKLVCFGQGHCHGVSSCMAAYLYCFGPILGLQQRYRSGYVFYENEMNPDGSVISSCRVKNNYDRHHWNERSLFPSGETLCCDLSRCGKSPYSLEELTTPIHQAYSMAGRRYPTGKFLFQSDYFRSS